MHDVAGFVILVGVVAILLFLLVNIVVPFVVTWLFGVVSFFVLAVLILRGGRLHPEHLPSLLKPGIPALLVLLSLTLPSAHALVLGLTSRGSGPWPWVLAGNALLPVAWTLRSLVRHFRERRRFLREGHDIEQVLAIAQSRDRALGLAIDRLEMATAQQRAPEPWEGVAGEAVGCTLFPPADVEHLAARIAALRPAFQDVAAALSAAFEEVVAGREPALPHPVAAQSRTRLAALAADADEVLRQVGDVLWDHEPWTQGPV